MGSGPETRWSLVARLRDPTDQEAWRQFVAIYQPLIQRLALHKGFQHADAQEVAQEVLLAVAGAIDRFQPDPGRASFRTWLFRIARNLMINVLKRNERRPRAVGGSEMIDLLQRQPARDADSQWFDQELRKEQFRWGAETIRGEFHESTWQAFWRTCVEGTAISAAAAELQMSVGAVYVARSRVMHRLKQKIEELPPID